MCAANKKHMSRETRHTINKGLDNNESFKQIGRTTGMDCTSISKEVRKNSYESCTGAFGKKFNPCIHRIECCETYICKNCPGKYERKCKNCRIQNCNQLCPRFEEETCPKLSKPPYVCNGCESLKECTLKKIKYDYSKAHAMYEARLRESREGIVIEQGDIDRLNNLLYPLVVEQGQSIHHVYIHHPDEIMFSEKKLYIIIEAGFLKVRNIDLPRKVRMRPRKKKSTIKIDKKCREGRTYDDFLKFLDEHPSGAIVQMDTVEGIKGGKVLLTIHFCNCSLMIAFIRDYNDSKSVIEIFESLYVTLGKETFKKMFPVLLGDNGSEFSNPTALEFDSEGNRRTFVFYCNPSAPYQKPECENNHRMIRRIRPKGKSLDDLDQEKVDLMMSHINSYGRESLNDRSPIDVFIALYGEEVLTKLNLRKINPDDINLTGSLFKTIGANEDEE